MDVNGKYSGLGYIVSSSARALDDSSLTMYKAEGSAQAAEAAPIPRDVRLISLILASMGIEDAEPAVLVQLVEFANRTFRERGEENRADAQDTRVKSFKTPLSTLIMLRRGREAAA